MIVRLLLEDDPDIRVVGEASDGHEAVEAADRLQPAVVVMDFALPSMNGAVATRLMRKARPDLAVLILSMHSEASYVRTCLEAGASGYLLKNAMDLELVAAVKQVASGARVLDPRLGSLAESGEEPPSLTTRELEVLQLIVNGKSNKEIVLEVLKRAFIDRDPTVVRHTDRHGPDRIRARGENTADCAPRTRRSSQIVPSPGWIPARPVGGRADGHRPGGRSGCAELEVDA